LDTPTPALPSLIGRLNERYVLRAIQTHGPLSRAELARHSGVSAPTASKAVETLLRAGLLEEGDAPPPRRGRPAKTLRMARRSAQVIGLVIDAAECTMVRASLDGRMADSSLTCFPTPATYEELLDAAVSIAGRLMERRGVTTFGVGISMPGLVDYSRHCGVLSPNLPMTDGRCPALDLSERLGVECVLVQESQALCLAERNYGAARSLTDFVMLDVGTGVGCGVFSGGRLLKGSSGMAGEIGHMTVRAEGGLQCGCGNSGCLETEACDSVLVRRASERMGRRFTISELIELHRSGAVDLEPEIDSLRRYLGIGLAALINLFNPATLFVHGRLFELEDGLFESVVAEAGKRSLPPLLKQCRIVRAQGSKRQGAVAAILDHITAVGAPQFTTAGGLAAVSSPARSPLGQAPLIAEAGLQV